MHKAESLVGFFAIDKESIQPLDLPRQTIGSFQCGVRFYCLADDSKADCMWLTIYAKFS